MPALHHIALGAQDVDALATFYRDGLGLVETLRHHHPDGSLRSVWLTLGESLLMIEEAQTPPPPRAERASGWCLLAFTSPSDSLTNQAETARKAGATDDGHTTSTRYFRDPEGNRFGLSCYPERR